MYKIFFLEQQLELLTRKGTDKKELKKIYKSLLDCLQNIENKSPVDAIEDLSYEIIEESERFLKAKNEYNDSLITALSSCIYLPSYPDGDYKIKFIGGIDSHDEEVTHDTLFDVASISKMYTLLLIFKLVEYGYFNLDDEISKLDNRFDLEDFTIRDLILLCGELYTKGNVRYAPSKEEAYNMFTTVYLKSNDRTRNLYTDMGMIVMSYVIEKIVSERIPELDSFDKIMDYFIFSKFDLTNTKYNPKEYSVAGNGNRENLVHDPKCRILGGAVGSAGIFTNSDDLAKLAKNMYVVNIVNYNYMQNLVSKDNLNWMGSVTFPNSIQSNKGLVGLYQKHPNKKEKWFQTHLYSDHSFTSQGFTGSLASFDHNNLIHHNILVASQQMGIEPDLERYPKGRAKGFMEACQIYHEAIVNYSLKVLLIKKYYELFGKQMDVDIEFKIR